MSNAVSIFEDKSGLATVRRESKLADKMGSGGGSLRRIALNTNGTFRRIVGGEQIGKAIPHELNIIIVDLLKDVSRVYYEGEYDPDAKPSAPDCFSNLGDKPDVNAKDAQASACSSCPQNVVGSGIKGKGKACRFQRRLAVLAVGDPKGEVYQLAVPAKSLFGKGVGNEHPFESYKNFLRANGEGCDTVVTKVMYDLDADTMELKFKAVRHLTEAEVELVEAAQADPETQRYVVLTASNPEAAKSKPKSVFADEATVEDAKPIKRASKKQEEDPAPKKKLADVINQWGDED